MDNQHIGWEMALLGTVLYRPETVEDALDVHPVDFSGPHKTLWAVILSLHNENKLELRTVIETLREKELLNTIASFENPAVFGEVYLAEIVSRRGGDAKFYIDQVIASSVRRGLRSVGGIISSLAQDANLTAQEALDRSEKAVIGLRRDRSGELGISMRDLMGAFAPRIKSMAAGTFVPPWEPTLVNLKKILLYIEEDEYVIWASRPGQGKSSILRKIAFEEANNGGEPLIFNMENSEIEYARAFLAMSMGINNELLKNPQTMTDILSKRVLAEIERLADMPLNIVTLGAPPVDKIERITRSMIHKAKPSLIFVDYVQLISNPGEGAVDNVTKTSTTLRGMSLNYKIPIFAAAQLSREIEKRGADANPQLSDLRQSGSLEQDATVVIFPRFLWANPNPSQLMEFPQNLERNGQLSQKPPAVPVRFHVAKNRNGPVGITDPILWDRSTGIYTDLDMRVQEQP